MQCERCRHEFPQSELRPPSLILRCLAAPYFIKALLISKAFRGEYSSLYCRTCRRQLNVYFFFFAFLFILITSVFVLQKNGLIGVNAR